MLDITMLWKIRRYVRKHPQEASPSENADAPGSNRKLPRDIVFDEENDERKDENNNLINPVGSTVCILNQHRENM